MQRWHVVTRVGRPRGHRHCSESQWLNDASSTAEFVRLADLVIVSCEDVFVVARGGIGWRGVVLVERLVVCDWERMARGTQHHLHAARTQRKELGLGIPRLG